ncbi:MAG TPA: right-handed parallel beta-helix repeat-containing protein [Candidatus Binataceae bacterium]|nr:right-handed parallel beta-helix repeat-containing protein [Candidatus Binataceae bacterium]
MKHGGTRLSVIAFAAVAWLAATSSAWGQSMPLDSCTTISSPGSYFLTKNLSAPSPSGTCFIINAPNVAIDFKGHTITGIGTDGSGVTDNGSEEDYATISNGKIRNFYFGINLVASGYATINKMQVTGSLRNGIAVRGCCNTFKQVKSNNNQQLGIFIGECCSALTNVKSNGNGGGIELEGGHFSVTQATANNNNGDGIFSPNCCIAISNSTVSGNTDYGLNLGQEPGGGNNTVIAVKANDNGNNGMMIQSGNNLVSSCTANGNQHNGIELRSANNLISGSTANHNSGIGIEVDNDIGNQVTTCKANHNHTGVSIECPGSLTSVKASHNPSGDILLGGGKCTQL